VSIKKQMFCTECSSTSVTRDAIVRWNLATQEWEVSSLLDNNDCDECGADSCVDERDATPEELAEWGVSRG
jgi:hypothetical protein